MRRGLFAVIAVAVAGVLAIPALAKLKATRDAEQVAGALMRQKDVRGADYVVIPPEGNPAGTSNKHIKGFPRKGSHFSILSTGNVKAAFRRNRSEMTGTANDGPTIRGTRDLVMLRTKFRVPRGKNCLFFNFKFLSEEFPEFVDSEFNDAFIAELDRTTWDSTRDEPIVDSPRNFARDSRGNPIRVNTVGNAAVKRKHARGTTYDGATRMLRASTRIDRGKHTLYLSIFDQGDRQYDSAVFLDGMRFRNRENCRSGVVVSK